MIQYGTKRHFVAVASVMAVLISTCLVQTASAGDLLGLYVGGALGEGRIETNAGGAFPNATDTFTKDHFAFKFMAGIRPLAWLGAEVSYDDFGHPNNRLGGAPADATMKGEAAFGILYLPVPLVDVFLKAGEARLKTTLNGTQFLSCTTIDPGNCVPSVPFRLDRSKTNFAAGAGVQCKVRALTIRGEYERFTTVGDHPQLLSIGLTWTFL